MRIVVLDAETLRFDSALWSGLEVMGELILHASTSVDQVAERVRGADAIFTNKVPLSAEVLRAARPKFVGVLATGYNIVDIAAAKELGVIVSNVPTYGTATTAQHAVALILELCNQVGAHSESVARGDWVRSELFSYWKQAPIELADRTVGIVGLGIIGRRVATVMDALGARIMASARTERNTPEFERFRWASNAEIFAEADIVSLHCPETPENTGFVDAALLATMRPGALLVNTARGGLICEEALAAALKSGQLGGAAVDVLKPEPMAADCPLLGAPNCIITPHIAWASEPARRRLLAASVENLKAFLAGNPVNVVS